MLCAICIDKNVRNIILTSCGHIFCLNCISRAIQSKKQCPLCQVDVDNIYEVENDSFDITNLEAKNVGTERLEYLKDIYLKLFQEFNKFAVEFFNKYKVQVLKCE